MYGFVALENLVNLNLVSIIIIGYLVACSFVMLKKSKHSIFTNVVFYINNLLVYPIVINRFSLEVSNKLIGSLFILSILYLIAHIFEINRELIVFSLIVLTLNSPLLNLYINVSGFKEVNVLFTGLVNYLWFTCASSSRLIKKRKKRKIKKV